MKTLLNHCQGYPKDLNELFGDDVLDFWYNGAVFDLDNGVLVKVAEDLSVIEAYLGFTRLTGESLFITITFI